MEQKDYIKELFSEKLGKHEVPVKAELWNSISSSLIQNAVVKTGISITSKILIGIGISAASLTLVLVLFSENEVQKINETPIKVEKEQKPVQIEAENELTIETPTVNHLPVENTEKTIQNIEKQIVSPAENTFIVLKTEEKRKIEDKAIKTEIVKEKEDILTEVKTKVQITQEKTPIEETKIVSKSDVFIGELPNVFTPNADGENDVFFIESKGLEDFVLTILNTKNEIVYKSTASNFKWDGRDLQGNMVPQGKYVYFFTAKDNLGNPVSKYKELNIFYSK